MLSHRRRELKREGSEGSFFIEEDEDVEDVEELGVVSHISIFSQPF